MRSTRGKRRILTIAVLPTMFTLGNLVCGFFAIVVAARIEAPEPGAINPSDPTNLMIAGWLIFLAMAFDALDGQLARLSGTTSDFGVQLDSLCDLVTFGVAPGFLLVKMCPDFTYIHRETVWVIAAAFASCAALRLARFNVETADDSDHLRFSGLPSPAAAATIASFGIMFYSLRIEHQHLDVAVTADRILQASLPYLALLMAFLMVSRIPYPHLVNQLLSGHRTFRHVVLLVFALAAVMVIRGYAVPIACCAFALGPPMRYVWEELVLRRPHEEPLF